MVYLVNMPLIAQLVEQSDKAIDLVITGWVAGSNPAK